MSSYCLKCRKNRESKNPKVVKTKNERIMLYPMCGGELSALIARLMPKCL